MKNDGDRSKKARGPQFPAFSLPAALDAARTIWERERKHAFSLKMLATHWSRSETSSRFLNSVRTLTRFGLLESAGGANWRLTKRALTLLLGEESEKPAHLKDAALSPPLYQELWDRYKADLPPGDALSNRLTLEGYHPLFVPSIIEDWRETMAFAGLEREDTRTGTVAEYSAPEEAEDAEPEESVSPEVKTPEPEAVKPVSPQPAEDAPLPLPPVAASVPPPPGAKAQGGYLTLPLLAGEVFLPLGMAEGEYHLLLHNLKVLKPRIVAV